jgi:hypothetical protein
MPTAIITVSVIAAVIVAGILAVATMAVIRRRRLQHRFGPEYDRVVGESDSKHKAQAELKERERRVRDLDIRPLTDSARGSYAEQWAGIQEQFVDTPGDAVTASHVLVVAVMSDRGYPTEHPDQVLADLSVEYASTLDRYRSAEAISQSAVSGTASTEDLRLALIDYRALFRDLLGEPDAPPGSAAGPPPPAIKPDDATPGTDQAQIPAARNTAEPSGLVADHANYSTADQITRELTK